MVLLGLLLLAAAVVAAVELILANRSEVSVSMWNQTWHVDLFWVAVAGAAILLVGVIGLAMMRAGAARSWRLRRERRELAAENRRLSEHVATRDEVVEAEPRDGLQPAPRESMHRRMSDRLHHDRNHDGVDDRAEVGAAPMAPPATAGRYGGTGAGTPGAGAYGAGVRPDSPYTGPADRPGYIPPATGGTSGPGVPPAGETPLRRG